MVLFFFLAQIFRFKSLGKCLSIIKKNMYIEFEQILGL